MDVQTKHAVITPYTHTYDKFAALYLFATRVRGTNLDGMDVMYEDEFAGPESMPSDVLDIDVRVPYNCTKGKYGSATHRVAVEAGIEKEPAVHELIVLLNNNNKTGYLKSEPESLVWLIRELYEVAHNVDFKQHRLNVLRMMWPVLDAYFAAAEINLPEVITMRPFTMEGYASMLLICGKTGEEVHEALAPLSHGFDIVKTRHQQAEARAKTITPREFDVYTKQGRFELGHFIETDDNLVPKHYMKQRRNQFAVLIVRDREGCYAIKATGQPQDFRGLFLVLNDTEPGLWYHHDRAKPPMVLNGSASRKRTASALTPSQVIEMVQNYFLYVPGGRY